MSEHKNTILAIVLSLLVVVGWQYFIGYPQMEKQRQEAQLRQQEQSQVQPGATQPKATATAPAPLGSAPSLPSAPSTQPATASRESVIASTSRIGSGNVMAPTLSVTGHFFSFMRSPKCR